MQAGLSISSRTELWITLKQNMNEIWWKIETNL